MPLQPNLIERQIIKAGVIPAPLYDMGLPIFIINALLAAGEMKIFKTLKANPQLTLKELAEKTGTNERALHNLLRVLEQLGYVEKDNLKYKLTKYTEKSVPIDIFHDLIPFFKFQIRDTIDNLSLAMKEAPESGIIGWDKVKGGELGNSYQLAMRWLAGGMVDEVISHIKLPVEDGKMLDIGGAHGLYCVAVCRKYPKAKATVLDWPIGVESAKKTINNEKDISGSMDTYEADYNEDELPKGYDIAFLGQIVHGNNPEQNKNLFKKIAESTSENGKICILDQFSELSGTSFAKSVASLLGWNLFLFSNGRAYDIDDVKKWLKEVGFKKFEVKSLKKSPGMTVLIGSKK